MMLDARFRVAEMREKYDQGEDPLDPESQQGGGGHPFRHGGQQFHCRLRLDGLARNVNLAVTPPRNLGLDADILGKNPLRIRPEGKGGGSILTLSRLQNRGDLLPLGLFGRIQGHGMDGTAEPLCNLEISGNRSTVPDTHENSADSLTREKIKEPVEHWKIIADILHRKGVHLLASRTTASSVFRSSGK